MAAQKRKTLNPSSTLGDPPERRNIDFLQHPEMGSLDKARRRILDYGVDQAFYDLVKGNCDPDLLLVFLANASVEGPALDAWEARFGFGRRELNSVTKQMRQCAGYVERLDKNGSLRLAAWPKFKGGLNPRQFVDYLSSVPASLRQFADAVDGAASNPRFKPRAHTFANAALAQLVAYVVHRTGAPHDNEVSALVDAVRNKERTYTADALKTWRDQNKEPIRDAGQMFPSLFGR